MKTELRFVPQPWVTLREHTPWRVDELQAAYLWWVHGHSLDQLADNLGRHPRSVRGVLAGILEQKGLLRLHGVTYVQRAWNGGTWTRKISGDSFKLP